METFKGSKSRDLLGPITVTTVYLLLLLPWLTISNSQKGGFPSVEHGFYIREFASGGAHFLHCREIGAT